MSVIRDPSLAEAGIKKINWVKETYGRMDGHEGIDVLWDNIDFGVGVNA